MPFLINSPCHNAGAVCLYTINSNFSLYIYAETASLMKKLLLLIILFLFFAAGCRKKEEPPTLTSILTSKSWRVSFVRDQGAVYTVLYSGMKFTFTADGKVKVNDGVTTYDGTWSENKNAETFTLDIVSPRYELDFISDEWQVASSTYTGVNLKDNKSNTTEELRFSVF